MSNRLSGFIDYITDRGLQVHSTGYVKGQLWKSRFNRGQAACPTFHQQILYLYGRRPGN